MEYLYTDTDGNQIKFTEDMVKTALDERAELRVRLENSNILRDKHWDRIAEIRREVYDFFNGQYSTGDSELTFTVDDINELLESIGADKLKKLWTVSGRVEFTITDIEAESEDDAYQIVENGIQLELDGGSVDDWSLDITSTDEQ
jgi:hypothetical protein